MARIVHFRFTIAALVAVAVVTAFGVHVQAQADVEHEWEVLAEGLDGPRGIHVGDDGTVLVAEAGPGGDECYAGPEQDYGGVEFCQGDTGRIVRIGDGEVTTAVDELPSISQPESLFGPHDVTVTDEGEMIVALGALGSHEELGRYGQVLRAAEDGTWTTQADFLAFERERSPDDPYIGSNPYGVVLSDEGDVVVSDAAINALIRVDADGTPSIMAELEERMAEMPAAMREEDGPEEIPMDTVPTGLAVGPDGNYYVGELTGFPFPPGGARIWRVTPDGEAETHLEGFTNVIDVAFDSQGRLYVLEMLAGGLLAMDPEDPQTMQGRLVRIEEDGSRTTLARERLTFPTGLAIGPDDAVYVSNAAAAPGTGEVVRIELVE